MNFVPLRTTGKGIFRPFLSITATNMHYSTRLAKTLSCKDHLSINKADSEAAARMEGRLQCEYLKCSPWDTPLTCSQLLPSQSSSNLRPTPFLPISPFQVSSTSSSLISILCLLKMVGSSFTSARCKLLLLFDANPDKIKSIQKTLSCASS